MVPERMTHNLKQVLLRFRSSTSGEWFAHPDLRGRLVEAAEEKGSNATDVIVEVLSEHYGIGYDLTGRKSDPDPDIENMTVRLPAVLHEAVRDSAHMRHLSPPREVLRVLGEHYGLTLDRVAA